MPRRASPTAAGEAPHVVQGELIEQRLCERRAELAAVLRSDALTSVDLEHALASLLSLACELLGAGCASVWQRSEDGATLACTHGLAAELAAPRAGELLARAGFARFFAALDEQRGLGAGQLDEDERTRELAAVLSPRGVRAILCAPVFVRGRQAFLLWLEYAQAPRTWSVSERMAAATIADLIALVRSAQAERDSEAHLVSLRSELDTLLNTRTSQVVRENADLQREVDALQLAAEAIRKSEDDLRRLFAACPVPLVLLRRADQRVMLANEVAESSLRAGRDELHELAVQELFAHRSDLVDLFGAVARAGRDEAREVQLRGRDGQAFWALVSAREVVFGTIATVMIGFSDLTAQKAVEHQLRFLAQRDPLTQAYNRHHFWQLASNEMARVTRYRRPLSVAMIDADHFKRVNDEHGHDVGDQVLRMIVDRCQEALRTIDVLARYGGEELIVLLPETPVDGALAVVERLRERIAQAPLRLDDGRSVRVTVSIGLAGLTRFDEGLELLVKRADDALYAAKRRGRNCVEVAEGG